jgi:hypothetical protein
MSSDDTPDKETTAWLWGLFKFVVLPFIAMFALSSIFGNAIGLFSEGAAVAGEELGPRAALRKYEWFKNASTQLARKAADITVYQSRVDDMAEGYMGTPRKDWDRVDKEQMSQWMAEVARVKASYNGLAAEYNAAASKVNWASFEGDVPHTVTTYKDH